MNEKDPGHFNMDAKGASGAVSLIVFLTIPIWLGMLIGWHLRG